MSRTPSQSPRSPWPKRLSCGVLALLGLYLGFNLMVQTFVTQIHRSAVTFVVHERGAPLEGVEIRPGRGGSAAPVSSTGSLRGPHVPADEWFHSLPALFVSDAGGVVTYATAVQEQGWWAVPRLGLSRNLSGRTYRLTKPGFGITAITLPPYPGQSHTFRVELKRE